MTRRYQLLSIMIIMILLSGYSQAQVPVLPEEDNQVYVGKEYGAAGIIDVLIKTNQDFLNGSETVDEMIIASAEAIWEGRITYENSQYPTWSKTLGGLGIYPGEKYGPTGIMQSYLDIYETTNDKVWLERVISAYDLLISQAINSSTLPHWGYHYQFPGEQGGVAITDRKFGSGAVINIGLRLYELTANATYLEDVGRMIDWLSEVSLTIELENQSYQIVPWYWFDAVTSPPYFTGYETGIAGLIPLIYTYGKLANSVEDMQWAASLAQFLGAIQLDNGSWISESDIGVVYTGYEGGVAGILYGLHEYSKISNDTSMQLVIDDGIEWLFSQLVLNSTLSGFFYSQARTTIFNSFNRGSLGVLWTLAQMQSYLTATQLELLFDALDAFLVDNTLTFDWFGNVITFPLVSPYNFEFIDLSLGHGAAGLLTALVDFNALIPRDRLQLDVGSLIHGVIKGLSEMQRPDNLWNRQIDFNDEWLENAVFPVKTQNSQTVRSSSEAEAHLISGPLIVYAIILLALISEFKMIRLRFSKT